MKVTVANQPQIRIVSIRHNGPYHLIGQTFGKLQPSAQQAGLDQADHPLVAVFHDDPQTTPPAKMRADAGITIGASDSVPPGLTEIVLPSGQYATNRHVGPYESL